MVHYNRTFFLSAKATEIFSPRNLTDDSPEAFVKKPYDISARLWLAIKPYLKTNDLKQLLESLHLTSHFAACQHDKFNRLCYDCFAQTRGKRIRENFVLAPHGAAQLLIQFTDKHV